MGHADASLPPRVAEAFDATCAKGSCHDGEVWPQLTNDEERVSFAEEVNGLPLVAVGDLEGSYLGRKILAADGIEGDPMPPVIKSETDAENTAVIVGWIAGASFESFPEPWDVDDDADEPLPCVSRSPLPERPEFSADVWPILETYCVSCHEHGLGGLTLRTSDDEANMVGIAGGRGLVLVEPGSPDDSYLWHKVLGTHALVGGAGARMPGGRGLCPDDVELVYRWILSLDRGV
jgi:hypothetical protein